MSRPSILLGHIHFFLASMSLLFIQSGFIIGNNDFPPRSVRMAGDMFDQAIIAFIKRKYNLLIGERTAEQIKIEIGSAYALDPEMTMEIKGRNLVVSDDHCGTQARAAALQGSGRFLHRRIHHVRRRGDYRGLRERASGARAEGV